MLFVLYLNKISNSPAITTSPPIIDRQESEQLCAAVFPDWTYYKGKKLAGRCQFQGSRYVAPFIVELIDEK